MDYKLSNSVADTMIYCPLFEKEIAEGLCYEISNIGNDSLNLPKELTPPCGWKEANKICNKCPVYNEMW